MANQCYFNGNFYQAAAATTAGQSPTTNPASWSMIQIPEQWRWVLARMTYANLLETDGQTDKAAAVRLDARTNEYRGLDRLIREAANAEIFLGRPSVQQHW